MELFAGLSVLVLVLTALGIAIKTFMVWRRTRGLPELLLGTMLMTATVLGYPLAVASSRISPSDLWFVHFLSQSLFTVGYACLLLFTLRVFRPDAAWAKGLVGATLLALVGTAVVYAIELNGVNPRRPNEMLGLTLLSTGAIGVSYFWTMFESLSYYRQLRLRMKLGLAQAAVANRVLLWGMMSLAAGLAVVISFAAMMAGSFMSAGIITLMSVLGLVHAGCLFFAFHPPAWYRAWLEQGSGAEAGAA
jgi:hypothetical protein